MDISTPVAPSIGQCPRHLGGVSVQWSTLKDGRLLESASREVHSQAERLCNPLSRESEEYGFENGPRPEQCMIDRLPFKVHGMFDRSLGALNDFKSVA